MALKVHSDHIGGNGKVMRERQRVEILRDLIAGHFLSIADLMAPTDVPAVTEAV